MTDGEQIERVFAEASRARHRLSLEEVLSAGLPALYREFGERLLYLDGVIFDASDSSSPSEIPLGLVGELDQAVGLEFGWQHAGDCSCLLCSPEAA
jgi:hypothetical protein